jgi:hypothetical protein
MELDKEEFAQMLSEALMELPHLEGIVICYSKDDHTIHANWHGGRVLCRGLAEEMVDNMKQELIEAEELTEE